MTDLVPIPLVLFDRLQRAGLDVDAILRRARLPRSRFNVPRPHGTTAEFFALWRAVEELAVGDPTLGLRLGVQALPEEENVASLAAMHSATLGEGLKKLARYKRLVCPERILLQVADGEARIRFAWLAEESPPGILTDIIFAGVMNLARCGTRTQVRPLRLELMGRPANEASLRRHFRCELRFEAPHDLIVFEEAALALPMIHRNAQLLAVLLPGLERELAHAPRTRTLTDDVRIALSEALLGERPAIGKVAKSLGMSPRSMQRRLGELGTTYQSLLGDVRHRAALRLLASTDLAVGEVAFRLGFEEVNSFVRAFHTWEGTTPAKWRTRKHKGRDGPPGAAKRPRRTAGPRRAGRLSA